MSEQKDNPRDAQGSASSNKDAEDNELEAEQESAEAMDAEVPQPQTGKDER